MHGAGQEAECGARADDLGRQHGLPTAPTSTSARPDWKYHASSFTRWNWSDSDSPARTNSTLPAYCVGRAPRELVAPGLVEALRLEAERIERSRFGESLSPVTGRVYAAA